MVEKHPDVLLEHSRSMYLKAAPLSQMHEAIANIGMCGAITPNLDVLLERVFRVEEMGVFSPCEAEDAISRLKSDGFVLMKLRGMFARPESLQIWPSKAMQANVSNAALRRFISSALATRTVLFVGATLDEIDAWIGCADATQAAQRHYALVVKSEANGEKKAKALLQRFNIQCMSYPADSHSVAIEFLEALDVRVGLKAVSQAD
jgi:SIR2-like domain